MRQSTTTLQLDKQKLWKGIMLLLATLAMLSPAVHFTHAAHGQVPTPPVTCALTGPYGIAYDPTNTNVYVADYGSNTVSVISSVTNTIIDTIPVGANPNQVAYDPVNQEIYVSNSGSTTVSAISSVTDTVVATIAVDPNPPSAGQFGPYWLAFDAANSEMFVTNYNFPASSNTVAAIDPTNTLVHTITVGSNPIRLGYDPTNGDMYVDDYSSGQVSVIGSANTVVATVSVPGNPNTAGYDAQNHNMYITSNNSNDVTVIDSTLNSVPTTISGVNSNPYGAIYDPGNTEMFVSATAFPGDAIYTINSLTNALSSPIPANNPISPGPYTITYDPANNYMYASNTNDNSFSPSTVTAISPSNTVVANVAVGAQPDQSVFDTINNDLYVVNHNSNSVTIVSPTNAVVANVTSANCAPPPPPGCDENDGEGQFTGDNGNGNFQNDDDQCEDGNQNQVSSSNVGDGRDFKSTQIQSTTLDPQAHTVTITGLGTHGGVPVAFTLGALATGPTTPGWVSFRLSDGYSNAGSLTSGVILLQ